MSTSHDDQRSCDAKMGDALRASLSSSPVPGAVLAHIAEFLSFQNELTRRDAEKEGFTPVDPSNSPTSADNFDPKVELPPHPGVVPTGGVNSALALVEAMAQPTEIISGYVLPALLPVFRRRVARDPVLIPKWLGRGDASKALRSGLLGPSSLRASDTGLMSQHRAKVERLMKELAESEDKLSQFEAKLETRIGELERRLRNPVSSLLKAKQARKTKALEVRHLQRQKAEGAQRVVGLKRLSRDIALAVIEGRMCEIQMFQGREALSPQAKEAKLTARKEDLAAIEGDFDLIFKFVRILPSLSGDPEEQDFAVERDGDDAAPNSDEVMGEDEVSSLEDE
ncbi:hypothetical protein IGI04_040439 [Brassica rapa subsp. trilocularis]|uniref:Uncharacterized protein n=1 Tax=Brassica rapa subsp. trilocularis TaxID=1813537 RepID=A0ABQ7KNL7_BRACM|nr:hypothetical protein IGI04_040439 [Brassica rapa subsp. trilocularis]